MLALIGSQRTRYASNLEGSRSVFVADLNGEISTARQSGSELSPNRVSGRIREYAQAADTVYGTSIPAGYTRLWMEEGYRSGFAYAVYENSKGKVILAFRGTNGAADLAIDALHLANVRSQQQLDALWVVQRVVEQFGAENVTIVGHSLGGFLSQYAGSYTGLDTIAIDSAPFAATAIVGSHFRSILSTGLVQDNVHDCTAFRPTGCGSSYKQLGTEYYFDIFLNGRPTFTIAEYFRGCALYFSLGCHSVTFFVNTLEDYPAPPPTLSSQLFGVNP